MPIKKFHYHMIISKHLQYKLQENSFFEKLRLGSKKFFPFNHHRLIILVMRFNYWPHQLTTSNLLSVLLFQQWKYNVKNGLDSYLVQTMCHYMKGTLHSLYTFSGFIEKKLFREKIYVEYTGFSLQLHLH